MNNPYKNIGSNIITVTPKSGSITDTKRAIRTFKEINNLIENENYSFQPVHESKYGAGSVIEGRNHHVLSSYDYLGLIGHEKINDSAKKTIDQFGTGTGGVRLLTGTLSLHKQLERNLADFKGKEDAITFTSGYAANIAIATTIIGKSGKAYVDEYIHRSFIDALTLAGTDYILFSHNNTEELRKLLQKDHTIKRKFIVSEGVFSMEGDLCPLNELVELKKLYNTFLIIDEAHSFGVLGDSGKGIDEYFGIDPNNIDIISGSLSKTIPANGGFVLAQSDVVVYMQHQCAPFIFSGALCPPAVGASIAALEVIQDEKWRQAILKKNINTLHEILSTNGFDSTNHESPIIPIHTNDYDRTFNLAKFLRQKNLLATPVIFPAVAVNRSIIRICASVNHTEQMYAELDQALHEFNKL